MKINTILQEMENKRLAKNIRKKDPEWVKAKDKCLVEILKNIIENKK